MKPESTLSNSRHLFCTMNRANVVGRYQYHPGGNPKNPPKDAPSALHSVIVPNVNLPKVRSLSVPLGTQWMEELDDRPKTIESTTYIVGLY